MRPWWAGPRVTSRGVGRASSPIPSLLESRANIRGIRCAEPSLIPGVLRGRAFDLVDDRSAQDHLALRCLHLSLLHLVPDDCVWAWRRRGSGLRVGGWCGTRRVWIALDAARHV